MVLRTAGGVLVVFLWSVAVVRGQNVWSVTYSTQSICALKGSTVKLSCSFRYPRGHKVTSTFWFTKMETEDIGLDPEYAGHVEYCGDKEKDCTLRITDLRERDSATYRFRLLTDQEGGTYTGKLGVTLSVTGLQVKVTGGHQDKTLTCITTCTLTDNPTYIWYKNGQHLDESTSPQYKSSISSNYIDGYSCAVKGQEDLHSPAVCVQGQSCNRVTYTKRTICVLKGSTVDISCTYVGYYSTTSTFWFRSDKSTPEDLTRDPGYTGRVKYPDKETWRNEGPSILRISDLIEEDSAEYRFTFKTNSFEWGHSFPGTTLSVTGLQVKVTPAAEGQKTLTCSTTCTLTDNPTYIWYKNGQRLDEPTSQQYSSNTLVVLGHSADSYSCSVEGHEDFPSPAVYAPKNTSVSVSPSGEIVEGSSVTLTCSSDANPPVDKYTWYKKNVASPKASGQSYSITNISSEDRGEYYCEAENTIASHNSTALMIIVAEKQTSVIAAAVGIIVVVLGVILASCLSGFMWFRKKSSKSTSDTRHTADNGQGDSSPVYDNISGMAMTPTAAQTTATVDQDDVHYASIHFSRLKTVQLSQPQKQDEDVQYDAVKFDCPSYANQ
ncbi:B-cell receptor CD22-like isoform X2 [Salmo salar]|uniref:B-cell receptor CD22 n=1 Tax=Salmo salar TaxID=8030 RepID=A0ABM3E1J4_SALSA|nr:B-cell receptor CD22-like isoform X2 [Salmo salar]